jgi:hypothetical protein
MIWDPEKHVIFFVPIFAFNANNPILLFLPISGDYTFNADTIDVRVL